MIHLFKKVFGKASCLPISVFFTLSLFSFLSTPSFSQNSWENNTKTEVVISKNATLENLATIKKNLEAKGLGFQYSNVAYNDNGEIVAITIQYTDANNNSGKYSTSSANPINSIVIIADGKHISVKSEGSGNQASINQGNGEQLQKEIEQQRDLMEERRKQMETEMEERQKEMKQRRERIRAQMQQQRDSIAKATYSSTADFEGKRHVISKNTTDEELAELKKSYALENISFQYTDLKRNAASELTHISITVDNGQGSVSTSNFGNGKLPITNIQLMVDETHTIMGNME